jgi:hypothetical protein
MKVRVINVAAIMSRALPMTAATALVMLSVGADAGYSASPARHLSTKRGFSLRAAPATAVVHAGSAVRYRITIRRHDFAGRVTLRISPRPPSGATARFSPARTRRSSSTLTILTRTQMAPGRYRIHLRARSGKLARSSWLTLTIAATPSSSTSFGTGRGTVGLAPFAIAGNVAGPLEPGALRPIDLQITNPNAFPLVVKDLRASVQALSAPAATASFPCTLSDFSVQPFSGPLPLTVPASSTRSLADLGVPAAQWPQISLLDLQTNQDGCRAASVTLAYSGTATAG